MKINDNNKNEDLNFLSSPFYEKTHIEFKESFNENEYETKLKNILPEKYYKYIPEIIANKKALHGSNREIAYILDGDGNKNVYNSDEESPLKIQIDKSLLDHGKIIKWVLISHNHPDGIIILSEQDIYTFILTKTEVAFISSPNHESIFINYMTDKNDEEMKKFIKKYIVFMRQLFLEVNKKFEDKIHKINECGEDKYIKKQIKSFQRKYFYQHQFEIIKRINESFEEEKCSIKIYIL